MYFIKKTQIKIKIKILLLDKTFTIILVKYFNYNNIFLLENVVKLSKYIKINHFTIKLEKAK